MTDRADEPGDERPREPIFGGRARRGSVFGRAMRETNPYARALDIGIDALGRHQAEHGPVKDKVDFILRATPSPERLREIETGGG